MSLQVYLLRRDATRALTLLLLLLLLLLQHPTSPPPRDQ
jgi:hypothetical protein